MSSVIGSLLGQECREARQLPTLSDGVVLRVRQASSVTLFDWLPLPRTDIQGALPLSKTSARASIVARA